VSGLLPALNVVRAIKLSACKEPFDVDGPVTDGDKLLLSAAIACVDSHLRQSLHAESTVLLTLLLASVMLTSHKRRICDQSRQVSSGNLTLVR